jgi:hypothetical protein
LAFATRTASVLADDFCFGGDAFANFLPMGVGTFEARSTGCVLMGPVTGLLLGMTDNAVWPSLFKAEKQTNGRGADLSPRAAARWSRRISPRRRRE